MSGTYVLSPLNSITHHQSLTSQILDYYCSRWGRGRWAEDTSERPVDCLANMYGERGSLTSLSLFLKYSSAHLMHS